MNRRDFVRSLMTVSAGAAAALYGNPFAPRMRFAFAQSTGKTLVAVFQRGGCDGLNTVVPFGDSNYYNLRQSLAIASPNPSNPDAAIDLNGFFGLHPGLAAFKAIWDAGGLAVLPAVQYPSASRSHFDGQYWIESARRSDASDGWLNRYLQAIPRTAELRAVGFSSGPPQSLRGPRIVSTFNSITDFKLGLPVADEQRLLSDLNEAYAQSPDSTKLNRALVQETGRAMVNDLGALNAVINQTYTPANGASYPNTTFGRQMKQTAQLINADLGLEVAALALGGWDTHSAEGGATGAMRGRLDDFSKSIAAFRQDLGTRMADVVVVTMTEFGRTPAQNGSDGTDHGHASVWFVLGGTVETGIYGSWPGLAPAQLLSGRYLNHSIDYRNVMGEVLTKHLGSTDLSAILPNHTFTPVNFMT